MKTTNRGEIERHWTLSSSSLVLDSHSPCPASERSSRGICSWPSRPTEVSAERKERGWFDLTFACLDVRVQDWPLMNSILPTCVFVILYLLFIFFARKWMKNRPAFELREFMFVYNVLQVVVCSYITYEVSYKDPSLHAVRISSPLL